MKRVLYSFIILFTCFSLTAGPDVNDVVETAQRWNVDPGELMSWVKSHQIEEKETEKIPSSSEDPGLIWEEDDNGEYWVVGAFDTVEELVVPAQYDGKPVRGIRDYAFEFRDDLTSVVISEGVRTIGAGAFGGCMNIKKVTLPSTCDLESWGEGAFYNIPDLEVSWTYPGSSLGAWKLNSIFDSSARIDMLLTGNSIADMGFEECPNIRSVRFRSGYVNFISYDSRCPDPFRSCVDLESVELPAYTKRVPSFNYCSSLTDIVIPAGATEIGTFLNCKKLESIIIPEGITSLPDSCFYGCISLANVILPKSLERIWNQAFWNCKSLKHIEFPEGLREFGQSCFAHSGLETVSFPPKITDIAPEMFDECSSLKTIEFGRRVRTIKTKAFRNCTALERVELPGSTATIESHVFSGCSSLESVIIPNSVDSIGTSAFRDCIKLKSVSLPESLELLQTSCFWGCRSLSAIDLPEDLQKIADYCFYDCTSLKEIFIPRSVERVGYQAFANWTGRQTIRVESGAETDRWGQDWLKTCDAAVRNDQSR